MDSLLRRTAASVAIGAIAAAFASCGGGGTSSPMAVPTGTSPPATLNAMPSSIEFNLSATPAAITLQSNVALQSFQPAYVSDPTLVGASVPIVTGTTTATFTVYPIAQGPAASIAVTDSAHASVTITKTQQACGRPPDILQSSRLIFPPPNSKRVTTGIGTLYFSVIEHSRVPAGGGLHLIVGAHQTLEGGSLFSATPPPGATTPPPPNDPSEYQHFEAGTVSVLEAGTSYRTQLWNDTCQFPVLTGGFST